MKIRKLLCCALVVILVFSLCSCGFGGAKIEGKGFKTPEEALEAYVKAFIAKDIDGMLSCFAVETYAENYDLEDNLDYYGVYTSATALPFPQTGDYSEKLAVKSREADVLQEIERQYLCLLTETETDDFYVPHPVSSDEDASDLLDDLFPNDESDLFKKMKFDGEFADPADLCDRYDSKEARKILSTKADIVGADEVVSVVAELEIYGDDYYMSFNAAEYDGVWYLLEMSSMITTILGLDTYSSGIFTEDDLG